MRLAKVYTRYIVQGESRKKMLSLLYRFAFGWKSERIFFMVESNGPDGKFKKFVLSIYVQSNMFDF